MSQVANIMRLAESPGFPSEDPRKQFQRRLGWYGFYPLELKV